MSFYPRLPDELKLKIWEEAIAPEHGAVHHFKIGFDRPRQYKQTLLVQPHKGTKDDPSRWVDLWNLSAASRIIENAQASPPPDKGDGPPEALALPSLGDVGEGKPADCGWPWLDTGVCANRAAT